MDWTKLLFQILNTAIMVLILYRFFFKSVRNTLDRRTAKVTRALDEAKERERKATEAYDRCQVQGEQIEQMIGLMRREAQDEARRACKRVFAETRHEIEAMQAQAKREIEEARAHGISAYQDELGRRVTAESGRLIREAGGPLFQKAVIEQLIERLSQMPPAQYPHLSPADPESVPIVHLSSAAELSDPSAARIKELRPR